MLIDSQQIEFDIKDFEEFRPEAIEWLSKRAKNLEVKRFTYLSSGMKVKGFSVIPRAEGKYPVIIYNRGGNNEFSKATGTLLFGWLADLASEGFAIIGTQYPGVDGGEGKDEFGGESDLQSVIDLKEVIDTDPKMDEKNISMLGWSRGGMMTYMLLRQRLDWIRVAVVGAAPTDQEASLKQRPEMKKVFEYCFGPITDEKLRERSVVFWADEIAHTPLRVLHAKDDKRVDYAHSANLAQKLTNTENFELVSFSDGGHILHKYQKERNRLTIEWFRRHSVENAAQALSG